MTEQAVQPEATTSDHTTHAAGRIPAWLVWMLIVGGVVLGWSNSFVHTWGRWFPAWKRTNLGLYDRIVEGESYYTHGPLVPLVSLLIAALLIRHTRIRVNPSRKWGGLVIGTALLMHLAASLARVSFASMFALIGLIAGLVLFFWGREALKRLWFPIAFLCFMVPLPEVSITQMNFRLKMFAAEIGTDLVSVVGVPVLRDGNVVSLPGPTSESELKKLEVANVCNGLRTLISLTAFGALYAYVCRLRGVWRLLLFLLSVPVALVANSLRITSLILVAHVWSVPAATGLYHDLSGLAIFVLAFMLMFGIENLILFLIGSFKTVEVRGLYDDVRRTDDDPPQLGRMLRATGRLGGLILTLVLLASSAYAL
ncbi:MAG: exosortase/archaeosortase family protein, partial [Planctomycetota bacterium]